MGSTPQSNALNNIISGAKVPEASTTGMKSQTITHPSGTTIKTDYHAPDASTQTGNNAGVITTPPLAADDASNKYNTATGQLNTKYSGYIAPTSGPVLAQNSGVNSGATPSPVVAPPADNTFSGLQSEMANRSRQSGQDYTNAQAEAKAIQDQQTALSTEYADKNKNIQQTAGFLTQANGEQGLLQQQYNTVADRLAQNYAGATNRLGAANTQQQIQQGLLGSAAGLTPEALRYGGSGSKLDPQTTSKQYAQDVISGKRSYADATTAMGLYGNAGKQFLDNAIKASQPDFNFAQAQTLSATQGAVAPQLNMAQTAIDNLSKTFATLPDWQKTGIPALNSLSSIVSNWTSIGLGSQTEKANAIKEARVQVANALGTATNTTPTSWDSTVSSWFPDNATPDQITAGVNQFTTMAKNRQGIYGEPGKVQPYTGEGTPAGDTGGSVQVGNTHYFQDNKGVWHYK
jgi:hypothetical protein